MGKKKKKKRMNERKNAKQVAHGKRVEFWKLGMGIFEEHSVSVREMLDGSKVVDDLLGFL